MVTQEEATLPNEFWKHLGKFDLSEYSPPRWSILVNDMGLQVKLFYPLKFPILNIAKFLRNS